MKIHETVGGLRLQAPDNVWTQLHFLKCITSLLRYLNSLHVLKSIGLSCFVHVFAPTMPMQLTFNYMYISLPQCCFRLLYVSKAIRLMSLINNSIKSFNLSTFGTFFTTNEGH